MNFEKLQKQLKVASNDYEMLLDSDDDFYMKNGEQIYNSYIEAVKAFVPIVKSMSLPSNAIEMLIDFENLLPTSQDKIVNLFVSWELT